MRKILTSSMIAGTALLVAACGGETNVNNTNTTDMGNDTMMTDNMGDMNDTMMTDNTAMSNETTTNTTTTTETNTTSTDTNGQ